MSNPRSEPPQRDLEDVLRRALRTAADSVEPAADGLDRIRFRICARRPVPSGWNMAELAGPAVPGNPVLRNLLPVSIAARAAFHAVVQRFRPGPNGIGWYRWLRPLPHWQPGSSSSWQAPGSSSLCRRSSRPPPAMAPHPVPVADASR